MSGKRKNSCMAGTTEELSRFVSSRPVSKTLAELLYEGPRPQPTQQQTVAVTTPSADNNSWWWRILPSSHRDEDSVLDEEPEYRFTLNVAMALYDSRKFITELVHRLALLKDNQNTKLFVYGDHDTYRERKHTSVEASISVIHEISELGASVSRMRTSGLIAPFGLQIEITLDEAEKNTYELFDAWITDIRVAVTEVLATEGALQGSLRNGYKAPPTDSVQ